MPITTVTNDSCDSGALSYCRIDRLSDGELLASTRRLVGRSNQILAALLAHLAEVETRGLHRSKACSGLYSYCIYELRFSEDAASRRVCAARLVKRFPALLEAVASGELHLTGLLMLGPHITSQNQIELLARAKFRTKKELAKLVRILDPLPDVPAQIVALGPPPVPAMTANASPAWPSFAHSLCPSVRELAPGDHPGDWATESLSNNEPGCEPLDASRSLESITAAPAREEPPGLESISTALAREEPPGLESITAALAREEPPSALIPPQRYRVQFTASEEHVQLIERAQALLSGRAANGGGLAEIHLRAMRVLVAELEKQKYGAARPRQREERAAPVAAGPAPQTAKASPTSEVPRQRVRHVPAAERRTVFERDGARCSYVDARGQRCRETRDLELHHLIPFARDGAHLSANLALFCRSHNTLAAEEDFGRSFVETKRNQSVHESWTKQETAERASSSISTG